ncbi:MAG: DUF308 domain-containing protein [Alloprevotella sp.]|nr:DUF308 domain-containing protein [Alloprevotella sp.]
MPRTITFQVIKSLALLCIGLLLVCYSKQAPNFLVQCIGLAVLLPGVASIVMLLRGNRSRTETILYPILGGAAVALGLLLLIWPSWFVGIFLYAVATLLVVFGVIQATSRWRMLRMGILLSWPSFLIPLLLIAVGIFILFRPDLAAPLPFVVLGAAYVLYAILELWSVWQLRAFYRRQAAEAVEISESEVVEDAEVVEEVKAIE